VKFVIHIRTFKGNKGRKYRRRNGKRNAVQILCFTNDSVVIAECEEDLANTLKKMNDNLKEHYIQINQWKTTKFMICSC